MAGEFFASPTGITDPQAELEATIQALLTDIDSDEPARCRYPAREIFLVRELNINPARLPPVRCTKYEDWRKHIDSESVSIVFASFFMGNPSSMFGHTFLRFHNQRGNALLDSSFNYAANAGEENAIVYAWLGMTGGFPGTYAMHPYYVKINEYNDMESRDLWEFKLNVTKDEVSFMLAHLWELSSVFFPYYYLDENCSYQLLTLLEATRPSALLTSRFSLYVTPTDTLHTLNENGFFTGETHYRAAIFTRYLLFYEHASNESRMEFRRLKDYRDLPASVTKETVTAADILLEYYKYIGDYDMQKWPEADNAHYQKLLAWRAASKTDSGLEVLILPDEHKNPLQGNKSSEIRLGGYGANPTGEAVVFGIRPALRELQDVSLGFSPWSQIQIMSFSMSYLTQRQTLRLEEFNLVDIFALAPWQAEIRKFSYRLRTGLYRHDVLVNTGASTLSWDSAAGGGITLSPGKFLGIFVLAEATSMVGSIWENSIRIAPGINSGIKLNWSPTIATLASYSIDYGLISTPNIMQKIEVRNVIGLWHNWAIELNYFFANTFLAGNEYTFQRASFYLKRFF